MKKVIIHPRLGEVIIFKTRRAKRMSVSVRPPATVRVTIPAGTSIRKGLKFLDEKEQWVTDTIKKVSVQYPVKIIEDGYRTKFHEIRFNPAVNADIKSRVTTDMVVVTFPDTLNYASPEVQTAAREALTRALRSEAKTVLPRLVAELAQQHGFKYGKVTIRATKGRWGSCSANNDISLSLSLMKLPWHLIEYIILHELCHTVYRDHSKEFHTLVDKVVEGREKELNAELKKHSTDII